MKFCWSDLQVLQIIYHEVRSPGASKNSSNKNIVNYCSTSFCKRMECVLLYTSACQFLPHIMKKKKNINARNNFEHHSKDWSILGKIVTITSRKKADIRKCLQMWGRRRKRRRGGRSMIWMVKLWWKNKSGWQKITQPVFQSLGLDWKY